MRRRLGLCTRLSLGVGQPLSRRTALRASRIRALALGIVRVWGWRGPLVCSAQTAERPSRRGRVLPRPWSCTHLSLCGLPARLSLFHCPRRTALRARLHTYPRPGHCTCAGVEAVPSTALHRPPNDHQGEAVCCLALGLVRVCRWDPRLSPIRCHRRTALRRSCTRSLVWGIVRVQ